MTTDRSVRDWLAARRRSAPLLLILAMGGVLVLQIDIASQTLTSRAHDPGVRGGDPGAGGPIAGLSPQQLEYFNAGKADFEEAEEVDEGIGPRMNLDSCGGCHLSRRSEGRVRR